MKIVVALLLSLALAGTASAAERLSLRTTAGQSLLAEGLDLFRLDRLGRWVPAPDGRYDLGDGAVLEVKAGRILNPGVLRGFDPQPEPPGARV